MYTKKSNLRTRTLYILLLIFTLALTLQTVSAETVAPASRDGGECVIPESGPWPPCATGGNGGGNNGGDNGECVIPESGPWPPCATGGSDGGNGTGAGECVIPASGPWPPCATGGGGGGSNPNPAPPTKPNAPSEAELRARIERALDQLEDYWKPQLKEQGVNYRPPGTVQIYTGEEGAPPNAFYVPSADAVFIDMRLLNELAVDYGEYAAVAVLAHEWGHFIQDQMKILTNDRPLRRIELQADCFTGSFTTHLSNIGQLGEGEYQSASNLFYSIGDDIINPSAPYNQPGAHGTGAERQTAFNHGWNTNFSNCLSTYN